NNVRFYFIAPDALAMPDYICEELDEAGIKYSLHNDMESVVPELDILYMTRVQKERFDESEYAHIKSAYILTADILKEAKSNLKVLHP
ncbi:aspartate carbamoyltransferase, partial [Vibrio campbellii]